MKPDLNPQKLPTIAEKVSSSPVSSSPRLLWCSDFPVEWSLWVPYPMNGNKPTKNLWGLQIYLRNLCAHDCVLCPHSGVFKVVQAAVCENEPASFPGLHSSPWGEMTGELITGEVAWIRTERKKSSRLITGVWLQNSCLDYSTVWLWQQRWGTEQGENGGKAVHKSSDFREYIPPGVKNIK